jgi:hypothetical protein
MESAAIDKKRMHFIPAKHPITGKRTAPPHVKTKPHVDPSDADRILQMFESRERYETAERHEMATYSGPGFLLSRREAVRFDMETIRAARMRRIVQAMPSDRTVDDARYERVQIGTTPGRVWWSDERTVEVATGHFKTERTDFSIPVLFPRYATRLRPISRNAVAWRREKARRADIALLGEVDTVSRNRVVKKAGCPAGKDARECISCLMQTIAPRQVCRLIGTAPVWFPVQEPSRIHANTPPSMDPDRTTPLVAWVSGPVVANRTDRMALLARTVKPVVMERDTSKDRHEPTEGPAPESYIAFVDRIAKTKTSAEGDGGIERWHDVTDNDAAGAGSAK